MTGMTAESLRTLGMDSVVTAPARATTASLRSVQRTNARADDATT
jgi:hypothetical protein